MLYELLKTLHVLSVVAWVGGMVFAHFFLRPSLGVLQPPQRLKLMNAVLARFFRAVLVAAPLAVATGAAMLALAVAPGFRMPPGWTLMAALGVLMLLVFLHIRFVPFKRLARAVAASDWTAGAAALSQVRLWVTVNLALGGVVLLAAYLGNAFVAWP